jgi:hypothetical protein
MARLDRRIELRVRGIRQPGPRLILAEQRDPQISAHNKRLTIGAEVHQRVVAGAVARIEDAAVFVFEAVPPHPFDDGETQIRHVPLVAITRLHEHFGYEALKQTVAFHE